MGHVPVVKCVLSKYDSSSSVILLQNIKDKYLECIRSTTAALQNRLVELFYNILNIHK